MPRFLATYPFWVAPILLFLDVLNKMNVITKTLQLADGRTITIETGKVAKQTDGAVMLKMNNTVLLATVCAAKDAVPGTDFMPLCRLTIVSSTAQLAVSQVDSQSAKVKPQTMKSSHHDWWTVFFVHCSQVTITQKYS